MSLDKIEIFTCDRSGTKEEMRGGRNANAWGRVAVTSRDGGQVVGRVDTGASGMLDLCPKCLGELMAWWASGAAQRPAPPSPQAVEENG